MKLRQNIESANIYQKCLDESDTDFIVELRSREDLNALSKNRINRDIHLNWYKDYLDRDDDIYWVNIEKSSGKRIGAGALFNIDWRSSKAEAGHSIILPEYRIYAFEIFYNRFMYAFNELKLNKIYAKVRESEQQILGMNLKLGYKHDGLIRQDYWDGEKFISFHLLSILREEFFANIPRYDEYLAKIQKLAGRL